MTRRSVVIQVEAGRPVLGLWCDTCLLPSVVEVPLLHLTSTGVGLIGTVRKCMQDGHQ